MDKSRRPVRHLDPKDDTSQGSTVDSLRASTTDSGRGSMTASERSTTLESRATNSTLSVLSRDTPLNAHEDTADKELQDDEPGKIKETLYPTHVLINYSLLVLYIFSSDSSYFCFRKSML